MAVVNTPLQESKLWALVDLLNVGISVDKWVTHERFPLFIKLW